jgi:hypothetical protein
MFHYIDDIISINNSKLGDFGDRIYPIGFEIKDITDTAMHLSYVDLHHECQLRTKEKTLFEVRLARIKARRGAQFVPLVMCVEKHKKYIVNQKEEMI